jgi:predicted Fe-Mo cluster-binding NifX family protein
MPLTRHHLGAPIAPHLGKAKWLAVLDDDGRAQVTRNVGLRGRWVAELFAAAGVTDVVADHVGEGAWRALTAVGIRVWRGAPGVPASELASRLLDGRLELVPRPDPEETHGRAPRHPHRERRRGSFEPH